MTLMTMKKILVVDDSQTVRRQVELALQGADFLVLQARDGHEGIASIEANPDLSLVITDVNMPNMDGLAMVEHIRADPRYENVRFVMLTTETDPGLIERGKSAGARGWIVKPFKADGLVAAVRKLTA